MTRKIMGGGLCPAFPAQSGPSENALPGHQPTPGVAHMLPGALRAVPDRPWETASEFVGLDLGETKDRAPSCGNESTQPLRRHEGDQARRFDLTDYQLRVVELVAQGKSNKEIARVLGVSMETVRSHVKKALRYSRLPNRTLLAVAYVTGALHY